MYIYNFTILRQIHNETRDLSQTHSSNYKIDVFQLSYIRITFKIPHHYTNSCLLGDHKNRQKSPKQMTVSIKWHDNDNNEI